MEKSAGIIAEFKDLDHSKGTGVIKHSVYTSIDKTRDISMQGMFDKNWKESKAKGLERNIKLFLNHNENKSIGFVKDVFDDKEGAYTVFKLKQSKAADIVEMVDEGAITGASFGYNTIKKDFIEVKGQKVRRLLEVKHLETSLLDIPPAHDGAGIVSLVKSLEEISDEDAIELLNWHNDHLVSLKSYVEKVESYCRKAKASDETIISLQNGLTEYKKIISDYDTAITQLATEPVASDEEMKSITNFINSLKLETWKKQSLSN